MAKTKSEFMFPVSPKEGSWEQELGMTKREYFAAKAMQAMIANPNIKRPRQDRHLGTDLKIFCHIAVEYADGLLAALNDNN